MASFTSTVTTTTSSSTSSVATPTSHSSPSITSPDSTSTRAVTEAPTCRFCMCSRVEDHQQATDHTLLTPCSCKGSIMYVHRHCLLEYFRFLEKKKECVNSFKCELCGTPYNVTRRRPPLMRVMWEWWLSESAQLADGAGVMWLVRALCGGCVHLVAAVSCGHRICFGVRALSLFLAAVLAFFLACVLTRVLPYAGCHFMGLLPDEEVLRAVEPPPLTWWDVAGSAVDHGVSMALTVGTVFLGASGAEVCAAAAGSERRLSGAVPSGAAGPRTLPDVRS
eukprot:gnl/Spiro4/5733_TR2933_c0_g1_i1.p1 gnl/Spiro4/5733_TR2933_c0_g1~~gnl/Spiro4/5733_TR2933_c0_g1_i1.p1  ORF type:complete len:301 (-),score=22.03 gnl/Spiro4/5733_TR2933_c0_g1_i1:272-1108(-)